MISRTVGELAKASQWLALGVTQQPLSMLNPVSSGSLDEIINKQQDFQEQKTSGSLVHRSVVNANSTHTGLKWLFLAMIISAGIVAVCFGVIAFHASQGALPASLAKWQFLGVLGEAGSITMMAGGAVLSLGGAVGAFFLIRKQRTDSLSGTYRHEEGDLAQRDVPKVLSIGAAEAPLDEEGIRAALRRVRGNRGSMNALIIDGSGDVRLNDDPGIGRLNPKKLILVGARIVHDPCAGKRLDDTLAGREEWLSSSVRNAPGYTFIKQETVSSVEEAMAHQPPSRGLFKGKYHLVYQVRG